MPRARTGMTGQDAAGRWYYRIQYTKASGKRCNVRRLVATKAKAENELRKMLNQHDTIGENAVDGERLRFRKLADVYEKQSIFEARYNKNEKKIAGRKSVAPVKVSLEVLKAHFADKLIRNITHADVEAFKILRLETPKANGEERAIATVNRELELMRAMMRFAQRQGWIPYSPFERGAPLISKADETRRERVLSYEEERRLFEACGERTRTYERVRHGKIERITAHDKGERRAHLRPLIVAALDTAARRGELLQLKWKDVDFAQRVIRLRATTTKTAKARTVPITPRLYDELQKLWQLSPMRLDVEVFGVGSIKTAFASACEDAKISGLTFHDLRHTATTRMVQTGMPESAIKKITGHTQAATFLRYVNPTDDSVRQVAEALHELNARAQAEAEAHAHESELVN